MFEIINCEQMKGTFDIDVNTVGVFVLSVSITQFLQNCYFMVDKLFTFPLNLKEK